MCFDANHSVADVHERLGVVVFSIASGISVTYVIIILCWDRAKRVAAQKGDINAAQWVTLNLYVQVFVLGVVLPFVRAFVLLIFGSVKTNFGTEGNAAKAYFLGCVICLRNFIPVGFLSYISRKNSGFRAIRWSLGMGCLYIIVMGGIVSEGLYSGVVSVDKKTFISFLALDVGNTFIFIFFGLKFLCCPTHRNLYHNGPHLPCVFGKVSWCLVYIICHIISSLIYAIGTLSYLPLHSDGDDAKSTGYCYYLAGHLWDSFTQQPFIYLAMIEDSQYWRYLGERLTNTEFTKAQIPHNKTAAQNLTTPLVDHHVRKNAQFDITLSPFQNFGIDLVDFTHLCITNSIHQGLNGVVVEATLWKKGKVAVKSVTNYKGDLTPVQIGHYCREALISKQLLRGHAHPNIVQFIGVCIHPPNLLLVYEFCNLGDLRKYLFKNSRNTSLRVRIDIARQCVVAVNYIHSENFIHRDIKTDNFLIKKESDGRLVVKLADFGTTRARGKQMTFFVGTFLYMAPELLQHFPSDMNLSEIDVGKTVTYGTKADVWSLTITLWEILALKRPYFHAMIVKPDKLRERLLSGKLKCHTEYWPVKWKSFFEKNFSRDPEARHSAQEMEVWFNTLGPDMYTEELSLKGRLLHFMTATDSFPSFLRLPTKNSTFSTLGSMDIQT